MRAHGFIAFMVGIGLTLWTCVLLVSAQDEQLRRTFERDTEKIAVDTAVRLQTYFDMLLSLKGMFALSDAVNRVQFSRYVHELNLTARYPGFQAIQFVRQVDDKQLERFSAAVRADRSLLGSGYPTFAVHPQAARDLHYVIEYNEPMKGNEAAFGLDLAALPPHLRAIETGRDGGIITATERIILVQDATGQPGFVARAPVYRHGLPLETVAQRRAAFIGMVAIVFRVNNLMREVIDPQLLAHLALRVHDAGNISDGANAAAGSANLMFDTRGTPALAQPALSAQRRLGVAQRQWVMQFSALAGSRYSRDLRPVLVVAGCGVLISGLFAALLVSSSRSRRLAARLGETLGEQRAFQDSASVGIALFADGVITRCNRGLEEIMGYGAGELAGCRTAILAPPPAPGRADPFAVEAGVNRWQCECELVRKDGSRLWCLVNGKAMGADDLSHGGAWVIQDITERKRTEAALVDAKSGLETSLDELARQKANVEAAHSDLSAVLATLQQAQQNLITSEKMASLGALVAGIAHELNTPIGNCLLTATALSDMAAEFERRYADGGVKRSALEAHLADIRLACGIMSGSLRRAAELIASFKQVAVDQTSDQRRRFDLCDVVRDTLATYAAQLRRVNCEVRTELAAPLAMDSYPGSVGQVLSNLINNALLHAFEGRAGGRLLVQARAHGADSVQLVFGDDGVGMNAKVLKQVFDPFFTTKMGQGGSGLGMNIVYNIVTGMLGGAIEIDSLPASGTTVTVTIPRVAPHRPSDDAMTVLAPL